MTTLAAKHTVTARHVECSLEEYHARLEWSHSEIETGRRSWPLFHGYHVVKPPLWTRDGSDALDLGSVAHTCLTNPGGIGAVVAVIPSEVLNNQGHRKGAAWIQWSEENAGRIQLKADELEPVRQMIRNVYAHPKARALLEKTLHTEFTILFCDEDTGLNLRARPDLIANGKMKTVNLVEFKTTRQTEPEWFLADSRRYGYHRQLAWYAEALRQFGYPKVEATIITADKSPAHQCRVYQLSPDILKLGHDENADTLRELARRLAQNDWLDKLDTEVCQIDLAVYA